MNVLICILYILCAVIGFTLIKIGGHDVPFMKVPIINIALSLRLCLGILIYGISFLIFTFFISRMTISIAIPVVSGVYMAITTYLGVWIFKEVLSIGQTVGITLIIVGTILVGIFKN